MSINKGRILGVDLGLKRTGLAISDELQITTRILDCFTPKSRLEDINFLTNICENLDVKIILIGYALHTQTHQESFMAKRARNFLTALKDKLPAHIQSYLADESYTSKEAARNLGNTKANSKKLDSESARILIKNFIHETH